MTEWKPRSFWLDSQDAQPGAPLDASTTADVLIVGGGYTGLWTALLLKEADPAIDIALIEANAIGHGASGRNGGFAMTMVARGIADLVSKVGARSARAVYDAMVEAIDDIDGFAGAASIADVWRSGNLTVSVRPEHDARIRADVRAAEAIGLDDFTLLDGRQVRDRVRHEQARMGHFEPHCLIIDPAKLVRGLHRVALTAGVRVYERTPVTELEVAGGRVRARTPFGEIGAERALLATNAYAQSIPALRRLIFTIYSYATVTEPLTDEQWARIGWSDRFGLEDKHTFLHYARPTADGRILWGGRDAPFSAAPPDDQPRPDPHILERLDESFHRAFPQLRDVRIDQAWSGPVCGKADCLASVRWLEGEAILYALGYSGHGVAATRLVAKIARDRLLGRETDLTALPLATRRPTPLPAGPLRAPLLGSLNHALLAADERPTSLAGLVGRAALAIAR